MAIYVKTAKVYQILPVEHLVMVLFLYSRLTITVFLLVDLIPSPVTRPILRSITCSCFLPASFTSYLAMPVVLHALYASLVMEVLHVNSLPSCGILVGTAARNQYTMDASSASFE